MINKPQKDIKKSPITPEELTKPSFLSELFKIPEDTTDAEAQRAENFGYTSRNIAPKGSFTK